MTDRYLEKVQVFTRSNCFGRSVTPWNYVILTLWTEQKNPYIKSIFEISGEERRLKFKNKKINVIDSSICALWKPINLMDNILKYNYMFSQLCLCSEKWICFYLQVFQISLLIHWVVGSVVGGSLGKWSVVGWLVGRWSMDLIKPRKKLVEVLFCYSIYSSLYWRQRKNKFDC